jgi:aminopeptidase YwaD
MISDTYLLRKCNIFLDTLCSAIKERAVGSEGNRDASRFFEKELSQLGWKTERDEFDAFDWSDGGASLSDGYMNFEVLVSPYSIGFKGKGELIAVSTIEELEQINTEGRILFLHGHIAREQLMPKNFVFYNPEEHQKIIALLEKSNAKAIICATGRNPDLAGGVYPFPLIEDGDFDIPSVYMTEEEGKKLKALTGTSLSLESVSERIPGKGFNVTGRTGKANAKRIVVTAHIDAKKGTPGAIDNATGVIVLMLLAELLKDYAGERLIELVALNGEDYYAVPGQMNYIRANYGRFGDMLVNINIDGAGYKDGPSAFSFYDLSADMLEKAGKVLEKYPGIVEGAQWPQGDHSIFIQSGVPAIAVSSDWFTENISVQDITHTPKDKPEIVDCRKLVEISYALKEIIIQL